MQLNQLKRNHPRRRRKIVGRGGKRGTTAGRGTKGQKARAGHRIRPELRDTIKKLPKRRGYRFVGRGRANQTVSLDLVSRHFVAGETVSPQTLAVKGLIRNARSPVKILGGRVGSARPAVEWPRFKITNCHLSKSAAAALAGNR